MLLKLTQLEAGEVEERIRNGKGRFFWLEKLNHDSNQAE